WEPRLRPAETMARRANRLDYHAATGPGIAAFEGMRHEARRDRGDSYHRPFRPLGGLEQRRLHRKQRRAGLDLRAGVDGKAAEPLALDGADIQEIALDIAEIDALV